MNELERIAVARLKYYLRTVGLTLWNLSCLEFKFDDTRLSYWHKNKIVRIEIFLCCFLTLLIFCPIGWSQQNWLSQQDRKLAKSESKKKISILPILFLWINRKVWYHQIWIPSNLGFIVSDLMYIPAEYIHRSLKGHLPNCEHYEVPPNSGNKN